MNVQGVAMHAAAHCPPLKEKMLAKFSSRVLLQGKVDVQVAYRIRVVILSTA
jgi:hypothetical protein